MKYVVVTSLGYLADWNARKGCVTYTRVFDNAAIFTADAALSIQKKFHGAAILDSNQKLMLSKEVK
jgi:hypothetical protein